MKQNQNVFLQASLSQALDIQVPTIYLIDLNLYLKAMRYSQYVLYSSIQICQMERVSVLGSNPTPSFSQSCFLRNRLE